MGRPITNVGLHDQVHQRHFQLCRRLARQSDAGGRACGRRATGVIVVAVSIAVVTRVIARHRDRTAELQRRIGYCRLKRRRPGHDDHKGGRQQFAKPLHGKTIISRGLQLKSQAGDQRAAVALGRSGSIPWKGCSINNMDEQRSIRGTRNTARNASNRTMTDPSRAPSMIALPRFCGLPHLYFGRPGRTVTSRTREEAAHGIRTGQKTSACTPSVSSSASSCIRSWRRLAANLSTLMAEFPIGRAGRCSPSSTSIAPL